MVPRGCDTPDHRDIVAEGFCPAADGMTSSRTGLPGQRWSGPKTCVETVLMDNTLLDAAFQLVTAYRMQRDPSNPYVDLDKANLSDLKKQFPGEESQVVEDAYQHAQRLRDVAVELAELSRGPRNDGTGPPFDGRALADRCPGFSQATYEAAVGVGFMLIRK
jgi:hypothetical protein